MTPSVYKYTSARFAGAILRDLELKITPPNEFNDPFEFSPHVTCSLPAREGKRILRSKSEMKEMYHEDKRAGAFVGSFRQYRERLQGVRQSLIAGIVARMSEANLYLQRNHLNGVSLALGLLCLSKRCDSIVMWGHYGDQHRGAVVGFNPLWDVFAGGKGLRPVEYSRERLTWDSSWEPGSAKEKAYRERMISRKNDEWAYEEELRQLFQLSGLQRRKLDGDKFGYFLPISADAVTSVFVGTRCSVKDEKDLRNILKAAHFSHVPEVKRGRLHHKDFALDFS